MNEFILYSKYNFFNFRFLCFFIGVYCSIYKGSYNVSNILYLNSPPPLLSFIPSPLIPGTVSRYHFWIYTCVYIICIIFILLPLSPPPPIHANTPRGEWGRQNLFHPTVVRFCRRKNIKDKKRNMVFLLVGDKDNYTGKFLVFPCIYVLQPQMVLPVFFTSPQSPSHGGPSQFKISIFIPVQWAHQPHSSFWFPSLVLSLPYVVSP
jgi:hypothetical protein